MKKDRLPETWRQKLEKLAKAETYVYYYQTPEQVESARQAVQRANRKKGAHFRMNVGRVRFTIVRDY